MSDHTTGPYKTLISAILVQRTAFSTGGRDPHNRVDSPVARNGEDRLTLRGSGIAGAFISTANRLFGGALPPNVTAGAPSAQFQARQEARDKGLNLSRLPESVWRFHTSHPIEGQEPVLEVRSGVGIRQDTGAAAEGLKYEVETVPAGTRWTLLIEVDDYRDPDGRALPIALQVIETWSRVCVLGRNVARGLGWMQIDKESLRVLQLDAEDAVAWPDASRKPMDAFNVLANDKTKSRLLDAAARAEIRKKENPSGYQTYLGTGTIRIDAGPEETTWGLDTLSLGGGDAIRDIQDDALRTLVAAHPGGRDNMDPDLVLAWTRDVKGDPWPFIPGSGLRGPLRHTLSWWRRSQHHEIVHDPNTAIGRRQLAAKPKELLDPLERLFGSGTHSGVLLLSDAQIDRARFADDAILFLEQHAEDEFTGGTYAEAKFNRLALLRGTFRFQYLIEASTQKELDESRALMAQLQALGGHRQIPIGGANWRGHGWVHWSIDLPPESPQTMSNADQNPEKEAQS